MTATTKQIFAYFWLFGLVNNVLYVVILSAAVDIVGPGLPKSIVLLADIFPSLIIKIILPLCSQHATYSYRIYALMAMGGSGMVLVSLGSLEVSLLGIILASTASGLGESTFLQITHYYQHDALNGWSSGTGAAGLIGSSLYMLLTTVLKMPVPMALLLFSMWQLAFLLYFKLDVAVKVAGNQYERLDTQEGEGAGNAENSFEESTVEIAPAEKSDLKEHIIQTARRLRALIIPYMLPLGTIYFFEYLINQGVSPTLLFPLEERNFGFIQKYRDIYVLYGTLYQIGVFISRSSARFIRFRRLYLLSTLQGLNLVVLLIQSWFYISNSMWPILLLVFYEGLLGGASYVNCFSNVLDEVHKFEREFSLGAVSIADSFGILVAAFSGMLLEPKLCAHQVETGRPWCTLP
ncbi:HBR384Cp [Eremothecium sinecaudum]|uniref:Protein BTN n=1 Tax=Eremothecium sinecaudum TaxID=45286 RepID=A0A109UVA7_9SACH|nr:HBR384Cp [Eremothecium sinecaudum]AMD19285.1 HBR384Cp [Eremothecium sinecaudum]